MFTSTKEESPHDSSIHVNVGDPLGEESLKIEDISRRSQSGSQSPISQYFEAAQDGSDNGKDDVDESGRAEFDFDNGGFRKRHKQTLKDRRSAFNRFRLMCGKIVNNEIVQIGMIVLIIINAAVMGIATFDFVTDDPATEELFTNIDRGFLIIYTVELVMQFIYFGWHLIQDPWLVFDLVVVVASWGFDASGDSGNQFQIIRAFRIFRAFRLITRIKVLRDLVAAIGEVIPRMTAIGMLLILIFYIFAVLFTELFKDLELSAQYFTTLDRSLFTCYEMMTLEWAGIAREVMNEKSWAWAPFIAFIMITGFMVFNLIIAVICDAVSIIDQVAREREARAKGIILETPEEQLDFAQQRMDVLSERVDHMLKTQKDMQGMLELLSSELHRLDNSLPGRFSKDLNGTPS
mmetsp:Transcript_30080/g.49718  ORF Transcript_30080/g.49718 Transcript_30080/m.49718 type:complete len:405 (+) Transcript_30080:129-1343(+)|eukprot:CAMPEP_0119005646 /NCGR_PEP_ID=MMETSP1176-20130426/1847_1 /TAXON_ID=265551 /ORGANISM="Synedropsis recta cf, Strain CCMP1620" /LENGTH=404 /DNA_ID=CAMNT_0006957481 /DNA_START=107 /DNA_END=1321 /DNA_ORIENTATION=-